MWTSFTEEKRVAAQRQIVLVLIVTLSRLICNLSGQTVCYQIEGSLSGSAEALVKTCLAMSKRKAREKAEQVAVLKQRLMYC